MIFKICLLLCNLIICSEGQRSTDNSDDDNPESAINLPANTSLAQAVFPQSLNQVVVLYDIRQNRAQQIEFRLVPELRAEDAGAVANAGGASAAAGSQNQLNAFISSLPPSSNMQFFVSLSGGLIPFTRRFRPFIRHNVPEVFERSPLMDYITTEADLNVYLTEQATLLNEDPIQFLDYVTAQFRQAVLNGRSSVTKQEVLNWIHATIGSIRAQQLALSSSNELTSEQKLAVDIGISGLRPFFVQRETDAMMRHNRTRPPCLSLEIGENYESVNLIDSLTTWQSRFDQARLAEHHAAYNQILAMGDTIICPFGEGEQCLVTRSQAYRFLELQNIDLGSLALQDMQFLVDNDYLTGQELVNMIQRAK
jgi:hypothetical protein